MDRCSGAEVEVRQAVAPCLRIVSSSRDSAEVTEALRTIIHYLEGGNASASEKAEFNRANYTRVLQVLVSSLSSDWFHSLPAQERRELWDGFFLRGPPDQALLVLLDTISSTSDGSGLDWTVSVLESFLSAGRVGMLLWSRCLETNGRPDSVQLRETILTRLSSLPDLTANRLRTNTPARLLPQQYYTDLARDVLNTLENTCRALRAGQDCSLGFVAQLLGKVCMQGHGELVCRTLAPRLSSLTRSDALWRRVSCKLLENVPDRWVESVITALIHHLHGASALSRVMGNLVLKNKKVQFVLTHKVLLLQYQHPTQLLRTVLGYLALDHDRRPLLKQVLRSVCQVWSNSSAVRHTSLDQQLYVSKALLLCVNLLNQTEIQELREELLQCMLGGVQCRLDSSTEHVRRMGMVVGECLSQKLDTPTSQLQFQYEANEESRELLSLMEPQSEEEDEDEQQQQPDDAPRPQPESSGQSAEGQSMMSQPPAASQTSAKPAGHSSDSELDSDDELTPYDMSADQVKQKATPPRYVRDCLEALMSSDDPERVELSLQTAEELLRKNVSTAREVSVQFSKVLLHLEDRYSTAGFHTLRQSAMVALAVIHTQPVVEYLTTEFYSLNYSLRQRLDILEVLALAAQELSEPITEKKAVSQPVARAVTLEQCGEVEHWRQVVEKRIQSKTRRISKGASQPPKAAPNRYAPVAAYFFFPLLRNYDRPQVTFDLLGSDHLVLGQLVHTLGLLMHLAVNAPVATQMGKALLDFVWAIRFHADQMVRRGVLFAVCAVFLSMPGENLLLELSDDLVETRAWLADVAESDPDADCRSLAVQSLVLLEKNLKTHLQSPSMET
ncbi:telomere length regulation protein TEL2 homolog [Pygocentrus nattereri]|uniref:Telomere length regulation protein TEL2 homolog n=1 Tax=Pygocentrus nattereri TaxID=42514 RepID=A0AAR2K6X7_PYGNA|nr:telomere length regulation protein TEL2 homolog [Pygocentrus nattereri]